ncbi:MAG: aldehyde ferredoxin oxidoreductase C-terminal domain-containing protein, partial [Desulfovibrionaceae bacterium]|nr:aldehyde ferredoxin oxidoreductase C-terminal domain-containing protein [Desulfovibrionaceae bacterium]
ASLAVTGPAAENGVLFASIAVDRHHAAGRSGLGLTMAAKGLKYMLIRGTGRTKTHDPEMLKQARQDILRLTAASPVLMGGLGLSRYGTPALYDLMHSRRMMPTDNFRHTRFEAAARLNAHALAQRFRPKAAGCAGCHIRCKRVDESGRSLPEFESLSHFTALIGNDDLDAAVAANELCNEYGMDSISAGATLACLLEITGEEVSGGRVLELLRDTALGRGLGADLGRGSRRLAEYMGWPEKSMSVKGLELPAYDPRGAYGMALALAVATRGGCHLAAYPVSHEILRKPVATDRFSFSGKARMIKIAEDMNAAVDSLPACKFTFFAAGLEEYAKAYTAVTGEPSSAQDLLLAGERIYYNERIMNALNGLTIKDDDLPVRFFEDDGDSGAGVTVKALDRDEFLDARVRYCRVRGLDEHGRPTGQTAQRLGLEWND